MRRLAEEKEHINIEDFEDDYEKNPEDALIHSTYISNRDKTQIRKSRKPFSKKVIKDEFEQ